MVATTGTIIMYASNAENNRLYRAENPEALYVTLRQRFRDADLGYAIPMLPPRPSLPSRATNVEWLDKVHAINASMQARLREIAEPSPKSKLDYEGSISRVNLEIWEGAPPTEWNGSRAK